MGRQLVSVSPHVGRVLPAAQLNGGGFALKVQVKALKPHVNTTQSRRYPVRFESCRGHEAKCLVRSHYGR
jgi:hypothetical protein